eukprot:8894-Chlamydomonas_euryale.AAC.1
MEPHRGSALASLHHHPQPRGGHVPMSWQRPPRPELGVRRGGRGAKPRACRQAQPPRPRPLLPLGRLMPRAAQRAARCQGQRPAALRRSGEPCFWEKASRRGRLHPPTSPRRFALREPPPHTVCCTPARSRSSKSSSDAEQSAPHSDSASSRQPPSPSDPASCAQLPPSTAALGGGVTDAPRKALSSDIRPGALRSGGCAASAGVRAPSVSPHCCSADAMDARRCSAASAACARAASAARANATCVAAAARSAASASADSLAAASTAAVAACSSVMTAGGSACRTAAASKRANTSPNST